MGAVLLVVVCSICIVGSPFIDRIADAAKTSQSRWWMSADCWQRRGKNCRLQSGLQIQFIRSRIYAMCKYAE